MHELSKNSNTENLSKKIMPEPWS